MEKKSWFMQVGRRKPLHSMDSKEIREKKKKMPFQCLKGLGVDCQCQSIPLRQLSCGLLDSTSRTGFMDFLKNRGKNTEWAMVRYHEFFQNARAINERTVPREYENLMLMDILPVDMYARLEGMIRGAINYDKIEVLEMFEELLRSDYTTFIAESADNRCQEDW